MTEENKITILKAYLQKQDSERLTSQDVVDNLRDTVTLTVDEVSDFLLSRGWVPWRDDDRLVWKKIL